MNKQRLINEILCSVMKERCYYLSYSNCSNLYPSNFLRNYFKGDEYNTVERTKWKRTDKRAALQHITSTVSLLLYCINEQWEDFLCRHYYTKIQQP